jgi:hypothetical protein
VHDHLPYFRGWFEVRDGFSWLFEVRDGLVVGLKCSMGALNASQQPDKNLTHEPHLPTPLNAHAPTHLRFPHPLSYAHTNQLTSHPAPFPSLIFGICFWMLQLQGELDSRAAGGASR